MNALVYLILLAVVYLLLRQHGYLSHHRWPDSLGWAAQLVNGRQTWGVRAQYEAFPAPWVGRCWRWDPGWANLGWPRALRVRACNVTLFFYLGVPKR